MLAICGAMSLAGGTCLACGTTNTPNEKQFDRLSGLLVIAGLAMIGATMRIFF